MSEPKMVANRSSLQHQIFFVYKFSIACFVESDQMWNSLFSSFPFTKAKVTKTQVNIFIIKFSIQNEWDQRAGTFEVNF